jgi:hypothetical protein
MAAYSPWYVDCVVHYGFALPVADAVHLGSYPTPPGRAFTASWLYECCSLDPEREAARFAGKLVVKVAVLRSTSPPGSQLATFPRAEDLTPIWPLLAQVHVFVADVAIAAAQSSGNAAGPAVVQVQLDQAVLPAWLRACSQARALLHST